MNCVKCDKEIPQERLEAMPNAKMCVPCLVADGDVPTPKGRMVFSHKTAPEIEIVSSEAYRRANDMDPRGYYKSRTTQGDGE